MNDTSLGDTLSGIMRGGQEDEGQGSDPINLLLQVILPVTLILAILVFTKVNEYDRIINDLKGDPFHRKYEHVYLELQKQVLVRMLEEAKLKEERYLGIDMTDRDVQDAGFIFFDEGLVEDEYRDMSRRTYDHLYNRRSLVEDSVFNDVLQRADEELKRIEKQVDIQSRSLRQSLEDEDIEERRKALLRFAEEDIKKFMDFFAGECANIQIETINSIHGYFGEDLQKLDEWDPELRILEELYQRAESKEEEDTYSQAIFRRLHEKVKKDFEEQEAPFLPKTWEIRRLKFENLHGGVNVKEHH